MTGKEMRQRRNAIAETPPTERTVAILDAVHVAEMDKKALEQQLEIESGTWWEWTSPWRAESRYDSDGKEKPVRRIPEDVAGFWNKAVAAVISCAGDVVLTGYMFEIVRWPWSFGAGLAVLGTILTHAGLSSIYHVFRPPHQDPTPPDRLRRAKRGTKWSLGACAVAGAIAAVARNISTPIIPIMWLTTSSDIGLIIATMGLVSLAAHFGVQAHLYEESARRQRRYKKTARSIAEHEIFLGQLRLQQTT